MTFDDLFVSVDSQKKNTSEVNKLITVFKPLQSEKKEIIEKVENYALMQCVVICRKWE